MKIAVVGTGIISGRHLEAIANSPNCQLSAVCDINEEVVAKVAEKYGVPYFTDYTRIPGACDAEAVILNLPHWLHCDVAEFFLNKGLHVLVEKPMANTPEECRRMIAASQRSGKCLAVAHPQGFSATSREIRRIVESGELGQLYMVTEFRSDDYFRAARPKWFLKKALAGGGIVMNFGAHSMDRLFYITGSRPVSVTGTFGNLKTADDIEGHAQIAVKMENGINASITLCGYGDYGREMYYYFTEGALKVVDFSHLYRLEEGQWKEVKLPSLPTPIALEIEEFCKLAAGQPSLIPTGEYGLEVIENIHRIYSC
jgi:predicted dehydrogenase